MSAIKWEPKDERSGEWRAYVGKLRLREWNPYAGFEIQPTGDRLCRYYWSVETRACRVLASGGASTRKKARAMAEACAIAAQKAGLR